MGNSLKITIIALDIFGEKMAERLADIADQRILLKEDISTYPVFNHEENNVVFICGFDSNPGFMKVHYDSSILAFRVRAIAFGETAFADGGHPASNTIYVSPKPVSLYTPPDVYLEQCVAQAEKHIRSIIKLAEQENCYYCLDFYDILKFFSGAVYLDSLRFEKPDISRLNEDVGKIGSLIKERAKNSDKFSLALYLEIPSEVTIQDYDEFQNNIDSALPDVKKILTVKYNGDNEMPTVLSVVIVSR